MKNRLAARRTNLKLGELAQVLEAINTLNFPVTRRTPAQDVPRNNSPVGMSDESIVHAYTEAQQANSHCLL